MGKYQAYLQYRDSGLEWFGDIPSDWDVWKWKHTLISPMTYGANEAALDDDLKNPRYIRITDMNSDGTLRDDTFKSLPLEAAKNYLLKDGDILVARTGATVGKSFLYKEKFGLACFAGYLIRARINKNIVEPEFVSWYLQSDQYWKYISSSQIQATLQNVSAEKYGDMEIAIPSKRQDRLSIANFLDHETAKIDTLIEIQQQLIQLLKEKRQAVISHAVTKGLNPNAPMKDSGVDWLGEVPEGWEVCLLKFKCLEITDGAHISPETENGEKLFISITDIKKGIINFENALLTSSKSYDYLIKTGCQPFPGDILFSKDGTIGQTAITPENVDFVVASSLIIIRPDRTRVTSQFLDFLLQSALVAEQVESFVKGAALRRLSILNLLKVFGVFPAIEEQVRITNYLYKILTHFDELEEKAHELIKFQQERRTALISAAVTGKIDVRGFSVKRDKSLNTVEPILKK